MRLIDASGDGSMTKAWANAHVRTIVNILMNHLDILQVIADLLQRYTEKDAGEFEEELEGLQINQRRPSPSGEIVPKHIIDLTHAIRSIYENRAEITFLRGAIVEILTYELVNPRYEPGECCGNHRFLDNHGKEVTKQIDVAAISRKRHELEGYECKLKVRGVASIECNDLLYLAKTAQNEDYTTSVGIVTFDDEQQMRRYLQRKFKDLIEDLDSIVLYGVDTVNYLSNTPF